MKAIQLHTSKFQSTYLEGHKPIPILDNVYQCIETVTWQYKNVTSCDTPPAAQLQVPSKSFL